jgi:hypothetical protein
MFDLLLLFMTNASVSLLCSRLFYDKRISQEVLGDHLGEVTSLTFRLILDCIAM